MNKLETLKEVSFRESPQLSYNFQPIRKKGNESEEWVNYKELKTLAIKIRKEKGVITAYDWDEFFGIKDEDLFQVCGMDVEVDEKLKDGEFELRRNNDNL